MAAAPKFPPLLKLHYRERFTSQTVDPECEAVVFRVETGKFTERSWRGMGPGTYIRTAEITPGKTIFQ